MIMIRTDLRPKSMSYLFKRNKRYVNGLWYDTDSSGNITNPSNTRGQQYDSSTGQITIKTGNGATVVKEYNGVAGDSGNSIQGTNVSGGGTIYVPKTPVETTSIEAAPKMALAAAAPSVAAAPSASTGSSNIGTSALANAFKSINSGSYLFNNKFNDDLAEKYKTALYDESKGNNIVTHYSNGSTMTTSKNPDGTYKQVNTPAPKSEEPVTYNDGFAEYRKQQEKAQIQDQIKLLNQYKDTIGSAKTLSSTPVTTVASPTTVETPVTTSTTPTTPVDPDAEKIQSIYADIKQNGIAGYMFDISLIEDPDAYNAMREVLVAKYGEELTDKFLNDWANQYYAATGISAGNARYTATNGGTYGTKSSSNLTTITDLQSKLESDLASLASQYENATGKTNAEKSNKQVAEGRKDAMDDKRLKEKALAEYANATGLASGSIAQEDNAREIAYKQLMAQLAEQENENNEILKKYKEAYESDIQALYDQYDKDVETIKARANAVAGANVNIDANGNTTYIVTDGNGTMYKYTKAELVAKGKLSFVQSMDAENQALTFYGNPDNILYGNPLNDTFNTIQLLGNNKTVSYSSIPGLLFEGKVTATWDGKYLTYYGNY